MDSELKQCVDCGIKKHTSDFGTKKNYRKPHMPNYINSICKQCMVARMNKWREKNLEKFNSYHRNYRKTKK